MGSLLNARSASVWRGRWGVAAVLAFAGVAANAQPAPVLAGVWDVQTLVTFERLPMALASLERPASQSRKYRICIGPERARAPMLPRRLPPAAELVFDGQSYTGSFDDSAALRPQVDISYRRLSATAFEGSHDAAGQGLVARTQYFALYGGPHCGATPPGWPAETGEP